MFLFIINNDNNNNSKVMSNWTVVQKLLKLVRGLIFVQFL